MIKTTFDAEKSLDAFLSRIPHDFNAPIASLSGLIEMGRHLTENQEILQVFDMQEKVLENTQRLIKDVMEVSAIREHAPLLRSINLRHMLEDAFNSCREIKGSNEIEATFEMEFEELHADYYLSNLVFENIVRNAVSHAFPKSETFQPTLQFKAEVKANGHMISILDNGHGIPEEVQDHIFDMFTLGNTRVPGSGLGLFKAKMAMQRQLGDIRLERSCCNETEFVVIFA